jgi:hypothetical protein
MLGYTPGNFGTACIVVILIAGALSALPPDNKLAGAGIDASSEPSP